MTSEFVSDPERPTVTYGPSGPHRDGEWTLSVSCESERVEIALDERAMYSLWTEVKGVPWPDRDDDDRDRLVRELVHAANHADVESIQDALAVLKGQVVEP